jgi:hypothetical protein
MVWLYGPIGAGALSVKLLFHLVIYGLICIFCIKKLVLPDGVEAFYQT